MRAHLKRPLGTSVQVTHRKFFIATPCYGGQLFASYASGIESLLLSLTKSGVKYQCERLANESLITRARNRLVAQFLKSDCTDLLFIDADVGFSPRDVHALSMGDFDICVGAYPMKAYSWERIADAAKAGADPGGLPLAGAMFAANVPEAAAQAREVEIIQKGAYSYLEVHDGATGFMLIKREAIERFIDRYREEIAYTCDYEPDQGQTHYMVFQAAIDPAAAPGSLGRYLSEDYWFCRKWQQMGGRVYLSLDAKLTHTGMHRFAGDVSALFCAVDEPAAKGVEVEFADPVG